MADDFQRLLTLSAAQPLSLNAQAALGRPRVPQRSQLSLLIHHFLERFFNHETASPDGDAKTRLVQIAVATGLAPLVVAVYLWPVYHPIAGWPPGQPSHGGPPPYWLQVNHHFFFVLYSFVAVGIVTVFEWDMFFPDLLDLWVLKTLPIASFRVFAARVAAIAIFVAGFLFDANIFAALVLPEATDPPNLVRFLVAHTLAVGGAGLFAAAMVLALQGVLLSLLGERLFRRISLLLQSLSITALLMFMLLFPVFSGVISTLLKSPGNLAIFCPPFWFLGVYQSILEGASSLAIYNRLAAIAGVALSVVLAVTISSYPFAYLRRVRQLVEGSPARVTRAGFTRPLHSVLHTILIRQPIGRAVFHFIGQTVLRVPRYRVYLVLYGGVGLSVVAATLLRFSTTHEHVHLEISADGVRAALGMIAFWVITGFRMSFVSSGNRQGNWAFRIVHGRPPQFAAAISQLEAAKIWVLMAAGTITLVAEGALRIISPPKLLTAQATFAQTLVGAGMCLLLVDLMFSNVTTVAFTGEPQRNQSNLAFTVLKYFTFFPFVSVIPIASEPWIAKSLGHAAVAVAVLVAAHFLLRMYFRSTVRQHCNMPALEDEEEDFPMKLGLR